MQKKAAKDIHKPPFTLDHSSRNSLTAQMTDALRQAIVSGRYHTGESLPTVREWMHMLGVCTHVPEAALARLAKEGLIIARPRHGCIVAPRNSSIFRGHVLLVMPPGDYVHLANIMGWQLTRRLETAGYLVSRASSYITKNGKTDFARLRLALRQSVDLAIFIYESSDAAKCARQAGVPFVTIGNGFLPGALANVQVNSSTAMESLIAKCHADGIRTIEIIAKSSPCDDANTRLLMSAGFKAKTTTLPIDPSIPRPESIMVTAINAFAKRFRHGVGHLPDLLFFDDNFLAQGAVPILMQCGLNIPQTIQLAMMSTHGLGPTFPFPFMCINRDGYEDGDILADGVLAYFDTGTFPSEVVLKSKFLLK